MRFFTARRLALAAFLPALLTLTFVPGCAQQGEGERCGDEYGVSNNDDCGSGLTCQQVGDKVYRCCPSGTRSTDSRCTPGTGSAGASGADGSAGAGNASGTAGATAGGGSAGTVSSAGSSSDAGAAGSEP